MITVRTYKVKVYDYCMTECFICLYKSSCCSHMKIKKKIINFSSLCLRHIKVSNFTSSWVQNHERRETGDSRVVTSNMHCTGMLVS